MRLENKIALITGAAAALPDDTMGFGGAAAWAFVHEGARVVLADINDELGERSAASLRDAGHAAEYVHLDVTSASDWEDAFARIGAVFGDINVLVNNAGTAIGHTVEETTEECGTNRWAYTRKASFWVPERLSRQCVAPAVARSSTCPLSMALLGVLLLPHTTLPKVPFVRLRKPLPCNMHRKLFV